MDLEAVNKLKVTNELRKFKNESGGINFSKLFDIPKSERIVAMSKIDFENTVQVLSVSIGLAFESVNLKRPLTNSQIFDLAEAIIDDADSDGLSLEDLLLFLQRLTRGEYGEMYESMDVAKFMLKFGEYRDARWEAAIKLRDEKVLEYKQIGDMERTCTGMGTALDEHLSQFTTKLSAMKDELKEKNAELKRRREQDNF